MDINLPKMSGVECTRQLRALLPEVQIVMLTVYDDSDRIFQALQMGANGYLLKRASADEILQAIQDVHRGGAPMSAYIARKVVQSFQQQPPPPTPTRCSPNANPKCSATSRAVTATRKWPKPSA